MSEQKQSNARYTWKPFKVSYGFRGQQVTEEAYLTVTLGDKDVPSRQIVVLPTCNRFLAKWVSDKPCDHCILRARAIENVQKLNTLTEEDICVC